MVKSQENTKSDLFAEGGLIVNSNPQMDEDGIQTMPKDKKRINKNIFHIFKILKQMKDFDYCADQCKEFMNQYEQALEAMKSRNFEDMSLGECREFMESSYKLTENLAYDRLTEMPRLGVSLISKYFRYSLLCSGTG